jgi:PucR C-terminal helix-turn-helix domain/GGDEF-like domain
LTPNKSRRHDSRVKIRRESVAEADDVRVERARVLTELLGQLDTLTETAVAAISAEIPAYAARRDDDFYRDVGEQVREFYATVLKSLLEGRGVSVDDIAFMRPAAMRRARSGFALQDYINAFRVGLQKLWEAVVATAGDSSSGREAALTLASPLMRFIDFFSTQAGHAYVEFQQSVLAEADRERRDLLELLLGGELPASGPLRAAAQSHGIGPDTRMLVMLAAVSAELAQDPDAIRVASAAVLRADPHHATTLVVVRQGEIAAVPVVRADADPRELCARLEAEQERLSGDGTPLALGISTLAAGVPELPRAHAEARAALESLSGRAGVVALPRLAPLEYLLLRADETARRLIDPGLRAFIDDDLRRSGASSATLEEFARSDMNLRAAAAKLHIHPNTALYRMRRIEERTGRNPRRVADLFDLLVAIALARADIAP